MLAGSLLRRGGGIFIIAPVLRCYIPVLRCYIPVRRLTIKILLKAVK